MNLAAGDRMPAGEQWTAGIGRDSRLVCAEGKRFQRAMTGDWPVEQVQRDLE